MSSSKPRWKNISDRFRAELKDNITKRSESPYKVARELGVSNARVYQILSGYQCGANDTVFRLAERYGIRTDDFEITDGLLYKPNPNRVNKKSKTKRVSKKLIKDFIQARIDKGWSRVDLAKKSRVAMATVSSFELGRTVFINASVELMLNALGLDERKYGRGGDRSSAKAKKQVQKTKQGHNEHALNSVLEIHIKTQALLETKKRLEKMLQEVKEELEYTEKSA